MSLLTGNEVAKLDIATFIFSLSTPGEKHEKLYTDLIISDIVYQRKEAKCLQLLINSLLYSIIESIKDLYGNTLDMLQGVPKGATHGGYMTLAMFSALISMKKFLMLAKSYPKIPPVIDLNRRLLEQ